MPWPQNYNPLHSPAASTFAAAVPIALLLALLAVWHIRAHRAALAGLGAALAVAVFVFKMPAQLGFAAAGFGAAFGIFPICWIVLNAIFIYQLSVTTGGFEQLKTQIAGLSSDRRIQALLIAYCFGAFVEGCAGFGAPVAITTAMMIGLGFKPLEAAKLALIGNTAPVAFGSVGIPITTLAKVTDLDIHALSAMVGRQLPLFSLIIPFWLIAAQAGWRGMLQIWPACLACGASFAVVQFAVSNLHGPWLVDIAAGLASMFALVLVVRKRGIAVEKGALHMTARAWLPWLMLAGLVALWKVKPVDALLKSLADWKCKVPLIFEGIQRMPPVVRQPEFEKGVFDFPVFATTGTALLCAGLLAGLLLGVRPAALAKLYWQTMLRVRLSMLTIALMLSLGYVTRLSGTDTTLGLAFVATGSWFPFFSPLLGWLGVALTGSDTSSNVLFGNLQRVTAEQLGISPILTCGANSAGGVMGKMIDAQSIVVAQTASVGVPDAPDAGTILRAVFWHSLALAFLVGLLIWLQARVMPWMIPLP